MYASLSTTSGPIQIRELIEDNGPELMFLPPYSPFLNPIKNLFSQWKGFREKH